MLHGTEKMFRIRLGKLLCIKNADSTQIGTASINIYPDLELLTPSDHQETAPNVQKIEQNRS